MNLKDDEFNFKKVNLFKKAYEHRRNSCFLSNIKRNN
jgi:hypothetical protein